MARGGAWLGGERRPLLWKTKGGESYSGWTWSNFTYPNSFTVFTSLSRVYFAFFLIIYSRRVLRCSSRRWCLRLSRWCLSDSPVRSAPLSYARCASRSSWRLSTITLQCSSRSWTRLDCPAHPTNQSQDTSSNSGLRIQTAFSGTLNSLIILAFPRPPCPFLGIVWSISYCYIVSFSAYCFSRVRNLFLQRATPSEWPELTKPFVWPILLVYLKEVTGEYSWNYGLLACQHRNYLTQKGSFSKNCCMGLD